jgi:hypothetical protein
LLSDNLSDVPDDILTDTESDSDRDSVTERKIVQPEKLTVTVFQLQGQPNG